MPQARPYLLDTNILVVYLRAGSLGEHVEDTYHLMQNPYKPLLCVVSVGEILSLAAKWGWGKPRTEALDRLLNELVWVDVNRRDVLNAYASIVRFSEEQGKSAPQNDYWIAAVANTTGATLLTMDRHFDHLDGSYLHRVWIDEKAGGQGRSEA